MKACKLLILCFLVALFSVPATTHAAVVGDGTVYEAADQETMPAAEDYENMTRQEKREIRHNLRQDIKAQLKQVRKDQKAGKASDISIGLLVIIAILLPPLAMALYDGITNRFWLSLLLTLLFYLPGLIYTLVIILGGK